MLPTHASSTFSTPLPLTTLSWGGLDSPNYKPIYLPPHLKVKFYTPEGIGELRGDREIANKCYGQALCITETYPKNKKKFTTMVRKINKKKQREPSTKKPILEILMVATSDFMEQNFQARVQQSIKSQEQEKVELAVETDLSLLT